MTAVGLLHDRVLPFYDAQGVALERVLSDRGHEYCGRPLHHPFELYCLVQQIQHRTTKVGSPETNGMVERFHRTLKDEWFSLAYPPEAFRLGRGAAGRSRRLCGLLQRLPGPPRLPHPGPDAPANLCRSPGARVGVPLAA